MAPASKRRRTGLDPGKAGALALIAVGACLRLLFLDADPAHPLWAGYLPDEGRWTEQARRMALYGAPRFDSWYSPVHLVLAPLFQLASWVSFSIFGVGFASARLIPALSGTGLLVAAYLLLRTRLPVAGLLVAILVLALHPELVHLSRVAIPEIPALLFVFLAFAALVAAPGSRRAAVTAGLLTLVGVAMKGTAVFAAPVLALVLISVNEGPGRLRSAGAYLATVGLPLLAGVAVAASPPLQPVLSPSANPLEEILGFVHLAPPYQALATFLLEPASRPVNVLLLVSWTVSGTLLLGGARIPPGPARTLWVGAGVWAAGWVFVSALLGYFPARYQVHALAPLAVHLAAGVSLVQGLGREQVVRSLVERSGWARVAVAGWFAAPLALMIVPVVLDLLPAPPTSELRLRELLTALGLVTLGIAGIGLFVRLSPAAAFVFLLAPLVMGTLWLLGAELGVMHDSFWGRPGERDALRWLSVPAGIAAALLATRRGWGRSAPTVRGVGIGGAGIALAVGGLWLASSAHGVSVRTYTVAEAAAALGRTLDESTVVGTRRLSGLFLGNELRYTENLDETRPPVVISAGPIEEALEPLYVEVERHPLDLRGAEAVSDIPPEVRVYLKTSGDRETEARPAPRRWIPTAIPTASTFER